MAWTYNLHHSETTQSIGGAHRADYLPLPKTAPLTDKQVEDLKAAMRKNQPMIVVPNEAPGYVHKLLDAIIDGVPLDFDTLDVPADVEDRLRKAYMREPAHQQKMSEDSRLFGREQLLRAALPPAIEQKIRAENQPLGAILQRREDIMPMGDVDRSLLETALDYIERDELEAAREHLAAMTNGGLARAISDVQVLQVLMAGSIFRQINADLAGGRSEVVGDKIPNKEV